MLTIFFLEQVILSRLQKSSCTFYYRCVNKCPAKAITVALHGKVGSQYMGIKKH